MLPPDAPKILPLGKILSIFQPKLQKLSRSVRNRLAGAPGFEPGLRDSKSLVLPLDDAPARRPVYSAAADAVKEFATARREKQGKSPENICTDSNANDVMLVCLQLLSNVGRKFLLLQTLF